MEPIHPGQRTLSYPREFKENNTTPTVPDGSNTLRMQTNRHDDQGRDAVASSQPSHSPKRYSRHSVPALRKKLCKDATCVGLRSSASAAETAVVRDVHIEPFFCRDGSVLATAEHGGSIYPTFASGNYHDFQGLTLWGDPQEWTRDDSGVEELSGPPGEKCLPSFPTLRASCGQQPTLRPGKASGSKLSVTKRSNRYGGQSDEDLSDFPVDYDYQAEEVAQVLRRSRRKTKQPSRCVLNPNPGQKHHQAGSIDAAASSPIPRDLPQAEHALLSFTNPAYGAITVDFIPLGPSQPASCTPQAQSSTHTEPACPSGTKRRRVMADSHSAPSEASILADNAGRENQRLGRYQIGKSRKYRDFPWEVTCSSVLHDGRKVRQVFFTNHKFSPLAPDTNIVFLSHLIPKKYDSATRRQILWIFQCYAAYIPACVMEVNAPGDFPTVWNTKRFIIDKILPEEQIKIIPNFKHPLGPSGMGWPTKYGGEHHRALPAEIFLLIGHYLSRDSVQNLRLVNREFERKISRLAFRSVVVAFNPQIYGSVTSVNDCKGKGKQKAAMSSEEHAMTEREVFEENYDPKESHVKDGMRVFEQWGPEIKKFALTFEVTEDSLKGLVPKKRYVLHDSFWGTYKWPPVQYSRFEHTAELEEKADESSVMTTAFSKLKDIQEFGLSIISGLGWQTGPDVSDRAKLFSAKPVIFGPQYNVPDQSFRDNLLKWEEIVTEQTRTSKQILSASSDSLRFFDITKELPTDEFCPKVSFRNQAPKDGEIPPPIMFDSVNMESHLSLSQHFHQDDAFFDDTTVDHQPHPHTAIARTSIRINTGARRPAFPVPEADIETNGLKPASLSVEQDEWLMEMEWAQCAFLSSWCLAVLDNPSVFHGLSKFTIGNLSSGLLGSLQRDDIWGALPNLANLTVLVLPDWRRVSKDVQGNVKSKLIKPSHAQDLFETFLSNIFKKNRSIKTLKVGYIGGGEHAPGMYARNMNVLPAPIMRFRHPKVGIAIEDTLYLPNVENLILSNCWLTPEATKTFFSRMESTELKTVKFESVSLTADPDAALDDISIGPEGMDDQAIATRRNKWLNEDPMFGSWSEVIDTITPGLCIDHARYAHGRRAEKPPPAGPTSLESITFDSCGYVRLQKMIPSHLNQQTVPKLFSKPPECLRKRHEELGSLMLGKVDDELLGTIVPCLTDEEEGCLNAVWGMVMGWGDKEERWDAREDGMGIGGMGRFEGVVKKE